MDTQSKTAAEIAKECRDTIRDAQRVLRAVAPPPRKRNKRVRRELEGLTNPNPKGDSE